MTAQAALQHLLRGSGLTWRAAGANRYAVVRAADAAAAWPLEPVRVYGDATRERVYTEQEIAATPASNRDLSALIATHPAIRESGTAEDGANRGTLNVEDISIHGASPYQNLFLIDGVGATSRVDPANKSRNFTDVPATRKPIFWTLRCWAKCASSTTAFRSSMAHSTAAWWMRACAGRRAKTT